MQFLHMDPESAASLTFKPIKTFEAGSKREYLSQYSKRTLGMLVILW